MPRGDATGPEGMGPMTGRALGRCAGYPEPGFTGGPGRGMGAGRLRGGRGGGFGRGAGRRSMGGSWWPRRARWTPGPGEPAPYEAQAEALGSEQGIEALKSQASRLEQTLNMMKKQIEALETQGE